MWLGRGQCNADFHQVPLWPSDQHNLMQRCGVASSEEIAPNCVSYTHFFLNIALLMFYPISLSQSMCPISKDVAELASEDFVCWCGWQAYSGRGRGEGRWSSLDPALTAHKSVVGAWD